MAGAGGSNPESDRHSDQEAMPTLEQQEAMLKKKYGGLIPKKPPLISKDHGERAYFDSADWALGKQGASGVSEAKPHRNPMEALGLRPKLQPDSHHQLRTRRSLHHDHRDGEDGEGQGEPEAEEAGAGRIDVDATAK